MEIVEKEEYELAAHRVACSECAGDGANYASDNIVLIYAVGLSPVASLTWGLVQVDSPVVTLARTRSKQEAERRQAAGVSTRSCTRLASHTTCA